MLPNLTKRLETAIRNKRRVLIHYNRVDRSVDRSRVIEPHILFRSQEGTPGFVGYQVSGYSSRGREPPFWRPFQFKKIDNLVILEEVFSPRIEKGFGKVRAAIKGEELMVVDITPSEYYHLEPRIYGPPVPEHLHRGADIVRTVDRSVSR